MQPITQSHQQHIISRQHEQGLNSAGFQHLNLQTWHLKEQTCHPEHGIPTYCVHPGTIGQTKEDQQKPISCGMGGHLQQLECRKTFGQLELYLAQCSHL